MSQVEKKTRKSAIARTRSRSDACVIVSHARNKKPNLTLFSLKEPEFDGSFNTISSFSIPGFLQHPRGKSRRKAKEKSADCQVKSLQTVYSEH